MEKFALSSDNKFLAIYSNKLKAGTLLVVDPYDIENELNHFIYVDTELAEVENITWCG